MSHSIVFSNYYRLKHRRVVGQTNDRPLTSFLQKSHDPLGRTICLDARFALTHDSLGCTICFNARIAWAHDIDLDASLDQTYQSKIEYFGQKTVISSICLSRTEGIKCLGRMIFAYSARFHILNMP